MYWYRMVQISSDLSGVKDSPILNYHHVRYMHHSVSISQTNYSNKACTISKKYFCIFCNFMPYCITWLFIINTNNKLKIWVLLGIITKLKGNIHKSFISHIKKILKCEKYAR